MSKSIKLYYFAGRGRAEHLRHLLVLAGVEWENVVVDIETWPALKEEMPLGHLPVLEVDGIKIGQSLAIARYLGHEYGFKANNNLKNAKLDMIADVIGEAWNSPDISDWLLVLFGRLTVPDKAVFFKATVRPKLEQCASLFEKFLVENDANALLCGDKVTWVDVYAAEFFARFEDFGEPDCLEAYPHIQSLIARIHNIPEIRCYIEQRPKTIM